MSELDALTPTQRIHAENILDWLSTPAVVGDTDSTIQVVEGRAGSGKTFMIRAITQEAIARGYCNENMIGVAPTHLAARNLGENLPFDCKTIHSFLGLRMKKIKIETEEKIELSSLQKQKAGALVWTPEQESRLLILQDREQKSLQKMKQLQPSMTPETFAESLGGHVPSLIIIEECFMLSKDLVAAIQNMLVFNAGLDTLPKILCIGDPYQLPPIGEKRSLISAFTTIAELTEVVRQEGTLLEFVGAVWETVVSQDEAAINYAHQPYLNRDDSLIKLPQSVVVDNFMSQALEAGYENVRILTTSNDRVTELNAEIYKRLDRTYEDAFVPGDVLLTKGPVMRDPAYPDLPATDGEIVFSTSTPITIKHVIFRNETELPCGRVFHTYTMSAMCGNVEGEVIAVHPLEVQSLNDAIKEYRDHAKSAWSNSKKNRGQAGEKAQKAWRAFGLKNWDRCLNDDEFDSDEHKNRVLKTWARWRKESYNRLNLTPGMTLTEGNFQDIKKSRLWAEFYRVSQIADSLTMSYASTVHTAQGQTVQMVLIDMPKFIPRRKKNPESTWDSLRTYYTAVSRVGGEDAQLVIMT